MEGAFDYEDDVMQGPPPDVYMEELSDQDEPKQYVNAIAANTPNSRNASYLHFLNGLIIVPRGGNDMALKPGDVMVQLDPLKYSVIEKRSFFSYYDNDRVEDSVFGDIDLMTNFYKSKSPGSLMRMSNEQSECNASLLLAGGQDTFHIFSLADIYPNEEIIVFVDTKVMPTVELSGITPKYLKRLRSPDATSKDARRKLSTGSVRLVAEKIIQSDTVADKDEVEKGKTEVEVKRREIKLTVSQSTQTDEPIDESVVSVNKQLEMITLNEPNIPQREEETLVKSPDKFIIEVEKSNRKIPPQGETSTGSQSDRDIPLEKPGYPQTGGHNPITTGRRFVKAARHGDTEGVAIKLFKNKPPVEAESEGEEESPLRQREQTPERGGKEEEGEEEEEVEEMEEIEEARLDIPTEIPEDQMPIVDEDFVRKFLDREPGKNDMSPVRITENQLQYLTGGLLDRFDPGIHRDLSTIYFKQIEGTNTYRLLWYRMPTMSGNVDRQSDVSVIGPDRVTIAGSLTPTTDIRNLITVSEREGDEPLPPHYQEIPNFSESDLERARQVIARRRMEEEQLGVIRMGGEEEAESSEEEQIVRIQPSLTEEEVEENPRSPVITGEEDEGTRYGEPEEEGYGIGSEDITDTEESTIAEGVTLTDERGVADKGLPQEQEEGLRERARILDTQLGAPTVNPAQRTTVPTTKRRTGKVFQSTIKGKGKRPPGNQLIQSTLNFAQSATKTARDTRLNFTGGNASQPIEIDVPSAIYITSPTAPSGPSQEESPVELQPPIIPPVPRRRQGASSGSDVEASNPLTVPAKGGKVILSEATKKQETVELASEANILEELENVKQEVRARPTTRQSEREAMERASAATTVTIPDTPGRGRDIVPAAVRIATSPVRKPKGKSKGNMEGNFLIHGKTPDKPRSQKGEITSQNQPTEIRIEGTDPSKSGARVSYDFSGIKNSREGIWCRLQSEKDKRMSGNASYRSLTCASIDILKVILVRYFRMTKNSRFIDLGSGYGNVVFQIALSTALEACDGVDIGLMEKSYELAGKKILPINKWIYFISILSKQAVTRSFPQLSEDMKKVKFYFGRADSINLKDYTHVFTFNTLWSFDDMYGVFEQLLDPDSNLVVLVVTKPLSRLKPRESGTEAEQKADAEMIERAQNELYLVFKVGVSASQHTYHMYFYIKSKYVGHYKSLLEMSDKDMQAVATQMRDTIHETDAFITPNGISFQPTDDTINVHMGLIDGPASKYLHGSEPTQKGSQGTTQSMEIEPSKYRKKDIYQLEQEELEYPDGECNLL